MQEPPRSEGWCPFGKRQKPLAQGGLMSQMLRQHFLQMVVAIPLRLTWWCWTATRCRFCASLASASATL